MFGTFLCITLSLGLQNVSKSLNFKDTKIFTMTLFSSLVSGYVGFIYREALGTVVCPSRYPSRTDRHTDLNFWQEVN